MEIAAALLTMISITGFYFMGMIRDKWLDEDFAYLRKIKEELDDLR